MDDLVKRLRKERVISKLETGYISQKINPDGAEAADRIEQLEAAIKDWANAVLAHEGVLFLETMDSKQNKKIIEQIVYGDE